VGQKEPKKVKNKEYTTTMQARMVSRLMGPHAVSAAALSRETGISQPTLSRWKHAAAKIPVMPTKPAPKPEPNSGATPAKARKGRRTGADKLSWVVRAEGLEGEALGLFLRSEGIHLAELEQWRKLATEALGASGRQPPSKELRQLRAELARKDKALAETAALIVLKKKVAAIWGDEDDDTDGRND
jgi:transposase